MERRFVEWRIAQGDRLTLDTGAEVEACGPPWQVLPGAPCYVDVTSGHSTWSVPLEAVYAVGQTRGHVE